MADWLMNLDLNLGLLSPTSPTGDLETEPSSGESVGVGLQGQPLQPSIQETVGQSNSMERLRWRHLQMAFEERSVRFALESHLNGSVGIGVDGSVGIGVDGSVGIGVDGSGTSQVGEGSVAHEERSCEVLKKCENKLTLLESDSVEQKGNVEKTRNEKWSFFDCNICLDMSREPVLTCCGHLFCWSCIYRWLNIHSDTKECPVCKGEVTLKNVTPIYGRGDHTNEPEEDSDIKIPARPSAKRVESWRQTIQRTASLFPMEEVIRRLGARFELTQDFFQPPGVESELEPNSRASVTESLVNRIMTTRARRRERARAPAEPSHDVVLNAMMTLDREQTSATPENVVDLTQDRPEVLPPRQVPPLTYRRGQSNRGGSDSALEAYMARALDREPSDRALDAYMARARVRQLTSSIDDRDSFSSIAAMDRDSFSSIAAMDTAAEIDSLVSLSTSSSRRRHDASRSSDMDSGDSRSLRRRRLN